MVKISILMLTSSYRAFGGHEMVMNNISSGLLKLGYDVAIGAFSFARDPPPGVQRKILKRLRPINSHYDIIHSHQTFMNYYSLTSSKPFLFHWHGASSRSQELNLKLCGLVCGKRITKILSVSHAASLHLNAIAKNLQSEIIHNGVDTQFYNQYVPTPYKLGSPQLLFVGNLYPHKNVSTLVELMTVITKQYPSAHLQVIGKGEQSDAVKRLIESKGMARHIELVGQVNDEELRRRYSSCDVFVSASRWEMFDLPALEAMSCGKPVVLSGIPAHSELIELSGAGMTFDLLDKLTAIVDKILEVYENRDHLGKLARQYAEKNDWSKVSAKIGALYERLS